VLELVDVSKVYPGAPPVHALSGVDLAVTEGELAVIVGPSGSGKSTLISVLAGLLPAWSGTVTVGDGPWDGQSRGARAEHRRRWVALLAQRPAMLEALTVRENLQLTVGIRGSAAGNHAVEELADRLALTPLLNQPVQLLSGGELQRAALARALVSSAPLLLLDEPTASLDGALRSELRELLRGLVSQGRTLFVATHDEEFASACATRILRMNNGIVSSHD
jgi:putative ABC transport system ATP-binding protein